ncbi:hypothetical protein EYF80_057673 [Liparis tanakae]|uniref:Uncharacterized protein n=1 Tax=Liparis tanakae TaxID=230148 RepID=A0A4Z2ETB6_9TELE|nr:hypothetical protein EYF80_057673 [Liparis tanakae]
MKVSERAQEAWRRKKSFFRCTLGAPRSCGRTAPHLPSNRVLVQKLVASWLRASGASAFRRAPSGERLQASAFRRAPSGERLQASSFRRAPSGELLQASASRRAPSGERLQASVSLRRASHRHLRPVTYQNSPSSILRSSWLFSAGSRELHSDELQHRRPGFRTQATRSGPGQFEGAHSSLQAPVHST